MDIGKKLKELRSATGLTQKELANKLGVSFQAISEWELNKSRPEYEHLARVAKLYSVSVDYILELVDEFGNDIYQDPRIQAALEKGKQDSKFAPNFNDIFNNDRKKS